MTTETNAYLEGADTLESAVFQALGAASACWENLGGAGVFESDRAKAIGDELVAWIRAHRVSGAFSMPDETAAPLVPDETGQMSGTELIAAERKRQVEKEGWTPEHDAEHVTDDLVRAAVSYALPEAERGSKSVPVEYRASGRWESIQGEVPSLWPWSACFWKPTPDDRVRELVKAGALIAAEIDRLQRMEARRD